MRRVFVEAPTALSVSQIVQPTQAVRRAALFEDEDMVRRKLPYLVRHHEGTAEVMGRRRLVRGEVEMCQPVEGIRLLAGDAKRVEADDPVALGTAGSGGDSVVLPFDVQTQNRTWVVQQVRNDAADTLAGTGRSAG